MARQYCSAEQALTPKLIPTLAVLCLVSVAVLTPAGALSATQAQRSQLQNIEPTQPLSQGVEPGAVPDGLSNGDWASIQGQIAADKYRAYRWAAAGASINFEEMDYFKSSNNEAGDKFGTDVSISGDTMVIAAREESSSAKGVNGNQSDNSAPASGAVYVFVRSGNSWRQQAYLKASNTDSIDLFGWSAAISGDTLVVGAQGEASIAQGVNGDQSDNTLGYIGAAYVFVRNGTEWSQQAYLKPHNTGAGQSAFGYSVTISGDTLVVGAPLAIGLGAAYVFHRNGTEWSQQAYLRAPAPGFQDEFGAAVAISGDTLVVGARNEDSNATGIDGDATDNSAPLAGAAYVFTRDGTEWSMQAYLKTSNTGSDDRFGISTAIDGDTLVAGAFNENSSTNGINGDQDDNTAFDAGAAYVFTRSGSEWTQQAYLKASNSGGFDFFGRSVALFNDTLVVGANHESSNATGINGDQDDDSIPDAGAAYLFTRTGTTWSQQAYLKASNPGSDDRFGKDVAISADTLAVGGFLEDSNGTGINGNQNNDSAEDAGAAYVWRISGVQDFTINAGLNDAWFNPATAGQGFFIIVFPVIKMMFVAMFTFEVELPDPSTMATLGWAGQRWFTAFGPYEGDTAILDIEITSDGVFDSPEPVVSQVPDGTLTVEFEDCSTGMITYNIPSIDRMGVIPIQRLADDNEALCEELNAQ